MPEGMALAMFSIASADVQDATMIDATALRAPPPVSGSTPCAYGCEAPNITPIPRGVPYGINLVSRRLPGLVDVAKLGVRLRG